MYTTLNEIKKHKPCQSEWNKLLNNLGKTKPDNRKLSFKRILKSNGIHDAIWALRVLNYKDRCMFMYDIGMSVIDIFESRIKDDKRPREALNAIVEFKNGNISKSQLNDAANVAYAASDAASAAAYTTFAASDAAYTTFAAADAAYAAYAAAYAAAYVAADAAYAAADARNEKWNFIERLFIKHFG